MPIRARALFLYSSLIALYKKPGNFLLSHQAALAVPSAPEGLTSVFGMETGVSPPSRLPGFLSVQFSLIGGHET